MKYVLGIWNVVVFAGLVNWLIVIYVNSSDNLNFGVLYLNVWYILLMAFGLYTRFSNVKYLISKGIYKKGENNNDMLRRSSTKEFNKLN